jgi:hypothetical protein
MGKKKQSYQHAHSRKRKASTTYYESRVSQSDGAIFAQRYVKNYWAK